MLIDNCKGTIEIIDSTITNCQSVNSDYGGTIRTQGNANCALKITSSNITNNISSKNGGGIYWNARGANASLTITGTEQAPTVISGNEAGSYGGGVHLGGQSITIEHTLISGNTAPSGGGISMAPFDFSSTTGRGCSLVLGTGAQVLGNEATTYGGVFMNVYSGSATDHEDFSITVESGAVIQGNTAQYGGAFAVVQKTGGAENSANNSKKYDAYVNISGGTISGNTASADGGALYISRAYGTAGANYDLKVNISGGQISGNSATTGNGGAIYLTDNATNSKAQVTVSGGTIGGSENAAANTAVNGGAIYVNNGSVNMSAGTVSHNSAFANGGAVYVTGGSVLMSDGEMKKNTAANNGGAVYVNNGNFTMTSGKIIQNEATGATSNGGGVFVQGGNIVIGVEGCTGAGENHTVAPMDKIHPVIEGNSAKDSGGGIALTGNGNITMYCGDIVDNEAINRGRGLNIYMEKGQFDYYHGDVGALESPEQVIVGGKLVDHNKDGIIELHYYHCNIADHAGSHVGVLVEKVASASTGAKFNLPDGEKYWEAESGYRFLGWTFNGEADASQDKVRAKDDYEALGTPMQALDSHDSTQDSKIHMYALWAPETNYITYVGSVIDDKYVDETLVFSGDHPTQYTFSYSNQDIIVANPIKAGYELEGWYLYQKEEKNANWGDEYEPVYKAGSTSGYANLDYDKMADQFFAAGTNGTTVIPAEAMTFGDIVLIAKFTPAYTDLKITKSGVATGDGDLTFLFQITGTPYNTNLPQVDMTVVIQGNGNVTIADLPVGEYTVTELESWSWRYEAEDASQELTLIDPTQTENVTFTNNRTEVKWLDGESYAENIFGGVHTNNG